MTFNQSSIGLSPIPNDPNHLFFRKFPPSLNSGSMYDTSLYNAFMSHAQTTPTLTGVAPEPTQFNFPMTPSYLASMFQPASTLPPPRPPDPNLSGLSGIPLSRPIYSIPNLDLSSSFAVPTTSINSPPIFMALPQLPFSPPASLTTIPTIPRTTHPTFSANVPDARSLLPPVNPLLASIPTLADWIALYNAHQASLFASSATIPQTPIPAPVPVNNNITTANPTSFVSGGDSTIPIAVIRPCQFSNVQNIANEQIPITIPTIQAPTSHADISHANYSQVNHPVLDIPTTVDCNLSSTKINDISRVPDSLLKPAHSAIAPISSSTSAVQEYSQFPLLCGQPESNFEGARVNLLSARVDLLSSLTSSINPEYPHAALNEPATHDVASKPFKSSKESTESNGLATRTVEVIDISASPIPLSLISPSTTTSPDVSGPTTVPIATVSKGGRHEAPSVDVKVVSPSSTPDKAPVYCGAPLLPTEVERKKSSTESLKDSNPIENCYNDDEAGSPEIEVASPLQCNTTLAVEAEEEVLKLEVAPFRVEIDEDINVAYNESDDEMSLELNCAVEEVEKDAPSNEPTLGDGRRRSSCSLSKQEKELRRLRENIVKPDGSEEILYSDIGRPARRTTVQKINYVVDDVFTRETTQTDKDKEERKKKKRKRSKDQEDAELVPEQSLEPLAVEENKRPRKGRPRKRKLETEPKPLLITEPEPGPSEELHGPQVLDQELDVKKKRKLSREEHKAKKYKNELKNLVENIIQPEREMDDATFYTFSKRPARKVSARVIIYDEDESNDILDEKNTGDQEEYEYSMKDRKTVEKSLIKDGEEQDTTSISFADEKTEEKNDLKADQLIDEANSFSIDSLNESEKSTLEQDETEDDHILPTPTRRVSHTKSVDLPKSIEKSLPKISPLKRPKVSSKKKENVTSPVKPSMGVLDEIMDLIDLTHGEKKESEMMSKPSEKVDDVNIDVQTNQEHEHVVFDESEEGEIVSQTSEENSEVDVTTVDHNPVVFNGYIGSFAESPIKKTFTKSKTEQQYETIEELTGTRDRVMNLLKVYAEEKNKIMSESSSSDKKERQL